MSQRQDCMGFVDVFMVAKNRWRHQLRYTWLLICLLVVVKDLYIYVGGGMPSSVEGVIAVIGMMIIAFIVLFSALLCRTNAAATGQNTELTEIYAIVFKRILNVLLLVIYYVAVFAIFYCLAQYVATDFFNGHDHTDLIKKLIALSVVVVLPCIYILVLSLMALPLILLDKKNIFHAIVESFQMTWFHWLYVFNLYLLISFVVLITLPGTMHGKLFIHYHVIALYDLIVLGLIVPIICNMMILMLRELQRLNA